MLLFGVLIFKIVLEIIRAVVRRAGEAKPASLCAECLFAHIQYGATGRRAISCTFGGMVRPMKLDVPYCTDYRDRNIPQRASAIGFARKTATAE